MPDFRFYLISDRLNARHDAKVWLPKLADAGLRALQVREKDLSPAECLAYCLGLQGALGRNRAGCALYLNDRSDIALSLGLAGVHLREDSMPLALHDATLRQRLYFGVSTHSLEGVLRAEQAGAEFATFGPVYDTASKAAYGPPVGLKALEHVAARTKLPLFALGGVTPERSKACLTAGARGVAAISAIWNADNPVDALRTFQEALGSL